MLSRRGAEQRVGADTVRRGDRAGVRNLQVRVRSRQGEEADFLVSGEVVEIGPGAGARLASTWKHQPDPKRRRALLSCRPLVEVAWSAGLSSPPAGSSA